MSERNLKSSGSFSLSPEEGTLTATFAMGCFWSPDALFGSLYGVVRTRVGYCGGSTDNPTYRNLADHIETVQLDYDPGKISFQHLLHVFFTHHKPFAEPWKRQYTSALFFHNDEQQRIMSQVIEKNEAASGREIFTIVYPYRKFYMAEERHQKYKLQRQTELMEEFRKNYFKFSDFVSSTSAARINGLLYGHGKKEELQPVLDGLNLSVSVQQELQKKVMA